MRTRRYYFFRLITGLKHFFLCLIVLFSYHCQSSFAAPSIEIHGPQSDDSTHSGDDLKLLPASLNVAKAIGILTQLERWQAIKNKAVSPEANSLKLDLLEAILTASYEVRFVDNQIDHEVDRAREVYYYLTEQRDKALRINTYVNFISGGVTRMVSGGMLLGDVNHIAPDTLSAIEGVIQTSLASWGLFQLRGEKRLEHSGTANMLTPIFDPSSPMKSRYPNSVWTYLNSSPDGSGNTPTRRRMLLERWYNGGHFLMRNRHNMSNDERLKHVSGTNQASFRLTSGLLEDRMIMLTDLKTEISQMDDNVLEILQILRK